MTETAPSATPSEVTFADIQRRIADRATELASHPLLNRLRGAGTVEDARHIARQIAFFVMGFQDVTRLVRTTTRHPELAELALSNEVDDRGHDLWFLADLERLGVELDVAWLFSSEHAPTRDVTYSQMADVLRAKYDASRFAVGLALEASAAQFFSRMIEFLERMNRLEGLEYFGRRHQAVEAAHEIFHEARERLDAIVVPVAAVSEVLEVIERTFTGIESMASHIEAGLGGTRS